MSRATWIVLGVLTACPALYGVVFLVGMAVTIGFDGQERGEPDYEGTIAPFHVSAFLLLVVLFAIYLIHIHRHQPSEAAKSRWTSLIIFGSVFTMPVYWWTQMGPRQPAPAAARRSKASR